MSGVDRHYFRDKTWLLCGRFAWSKRSELEAQIEARGGRVLKRARLGLDFAACPGPALYHVPCVMESPLTDARRVGATLVGELELMWLLEGIDPFEARFEGPVQPMPPALAALHAPGPDVNLKATYFKGKRWYVYGTPRDRWGQVWPREGVRELAKAEKVPLHLVDTLDEADFVLYERATPRWGARLRPDLAKARARGVPIFGPPDAVALLRGQRPVLDAPKPELSGVLEELRGLLHDLHHDAAPWDAITRRLEAQRGAAAAVAIDYVRQTLDGMPEEARLRACLKPNTRWQALAFQGRALPAFEVIRAIELEAATLNSAKLRGLFGCTALDDVEAYALEHPGGMYQSRVHWEHFLAAERMTRLKRLRFAHQKIETRYLKRFAALERLQSITHLDLEGCGLGSGGVRALLEPSRFPKLRALRLHWAVVDIAGYGDGALFKALAGRPLSTLHTLAFNTPARQPERLHDFMAHPDLLGVRVFEVVNQTVGLDAAAIERSPLWEGLESLSIHGKAMEVWFPWERSPQLKQLAVEVSGSGEEVLRRVLGGELACSERLEVLKLVMYRAKEAWWAEVLGQARFPRLVRLELDNVALRRPHGGIDADAWRCVLAQARFPALRCLVLNGQEQVFSAEGRGCE